MQFLPNSSTTALASALLLLLSSVAVASPTPINNESAILRRAEKAGVVVTNLLKANATETCNPLECSCTDTTSSVVVCVVPNGGDKTKCPRMCEGINGKPAN